MKDTFIPYYFEGGGWDKLLSDLPAVCEPLIREFYANAAIREDELNCWIRGHEFTLDVHDIDEVLGLEGLEDHDFTNYKDKMLSIETVKNRIDGQREGGCLNTTAFLVDMRCLTTIMMFNLYPVRKLTTITMPELSSSWSSRRKPSLTSALTYLTQLWMRLEPPLGPS